MNATEAMQAFIRVTELASFTRAAESLGLPKASVSVAVRQLENRLGTQLLHRTTRQVQPTLDGQAFYSRCKALLADLDELESMFQHDKRSLRGRLRVDMPISVANRTVIPRLPEFLRDHPQLEIELSSTDRKVDLIAEGFDCVLRVGTLDDSNLVARKLGSLRIVNCASPDYLHRYGIPRTLDDLARHRMVHYVNTLGSKPLGWEYRDGTTYRCIPMAGGITVNNTEAYEAACLAGLGIVQAPVSGVQPLLDNGTLVEIMADYRAEPMPMSLVYARRHNLPRRTQVFMNWLAELLAPWLEDRPRA